MKTRYCSPPRLIPTQLCITALGRYNPELAPAADQPVTVSALNAARLLKTVAGWYDQHQQCCGRKPMSVTPDYGDEAPAADPAEDEQALAKDEPLVRLSEACYRGTLTAHKTRHYECQHRRCECFCHRSTSYAKSWKSA